MNQFIVEYARSKALQSACTYKISAIGFNHKGDMIGSAMNKRHVCLPKMGRHAEEELIKRYGRNLKTIVICRVNNQGELLPIDPCSKCSKMANKLNIRIKTIKGRSNA